MAGVQDALDAGDPATAIRRFLDFTLAPDGFGGLSPGVQAVMLANAHVLPLLLPRRPGSVHLRRRRADQHADPPRSPAKRTLRLFGR